MPSHYLIRELTLSKMGAALAPYDNIDLNGFRLAAYQEAGIPIEAILDLDGEAVRRERIRRGAIAAYAKGTRRLFMTAAAAIVAASPASAGPAVMPESEWPIFVACYLVMFGIPLALIVWTMVLRWRELRRGLPFHGQ